jgi:ERCC4-related helicase
MNLEARDLHWLSEMLRPVGLEVRSYQRSISQSALMGNTLVVLPTGLGKTVIAILVAAERLSDITGSKVLVLAPTKPLVLQHSELFRNHLKDADLTFGVLTGETHPDERRVVFEESTLVFATPEVVRNDLAEQRYTLQNVSLVVFDEAHRCVKDYAYTEVAEAYKKQATNQLVLGLTASPRSSTSQDAYPQFRRLRNLSPLGKESSVVSLGRYSTAKRMH